MTKNVGNAASIAAKSAALTQRYDRCDVLDNNAGIAKTYPFVDYPIEHWIEVKAVNVTGSML